jgi:hypothetical protein
LPAGFLPDKCSEKPDQTEAILAMLMNINDNITKMNAAGKNSSELARAGGGSNWDDGPNWEGGDRSYRIVENTYTKAKELKDRGDTRQFAMIYGQLSIELRRKA